MRRPHKAKEFFSEAEQAQIVETIIATEKECSAEIRVHLDTRNYIDTFDRASYIFEKLHMHKTEARNGVLIYMSIKNRQFAIIGDAGVHKVVTTDFWEECKDIATSLFKEDKFVEGLQKCICKVGEILKLHFPYQTDDINELPDTLSFE